MKQLNLVGSPDLIVGPQHGSDAGVYRVAPDLAVVTTADFFPPMVTDAHAFGRVAAANSISDVYAMGAKPVCALNLLVSEKDTPLPSLAAMMSGAQDVVLEAGAVIAGGHTVTGPTVMFGLSVTGTVHPDKLVTNVDAKPGDVLVLTKPLGSGITIHAFNAGATGEAELASCVDVMATLNKFAGEFVGNEQVNASTDITGFGFIGHALDMLSLGKVGFEFDYNAIPLMPNADKLAIEGNYPGGSMRNAEYTDCKVDFRGDPQAARLVLNDAQTSGGLLVALPEALADKLLSGLAGSGYSLSAAVVGKVVADHPGRIVVNC